MNEPAGTRGAMEEAAHFTLQPGRDNYCVIGNPIAHSRSPFIHAEFARQTGETIAYGAVLVGHGQLAATLERFRAAGMRGLNVTLPFKEQVCALAEDVLPRARVAGAANTLRLSAEGHWQADNTDGAGLVRDLTANQGLSLAGRRILLLGAGGSARGVLGPLLAARPAVLHVVNRRAERAVELAARFAAEGPVTGGGYAALPPGVFDLVLNATAASLAGAMPPLPPGCVGADSLCYDLMYAPEPTVFMRWALAQGAGRALDGLGMLVEQAAESFWLWRGVRPRTAPVLAALRRQLSGGAGH